MGSADDRLRRNAACSIVRANKEEKLAVKRTDLPSYLYIRSFCSVFEVNKNFFGLLFSVISTDFTHKLNKLRLRTPA
jgi:hypothetical protein